MTLFTRLFAALGLVLALTLPVFAQQLDDAQRAALAARVESFDAAMEVSDMTGVLGAIPPKMLEKIAAASNVSIQQLIATMQEQVNKMLTEIKMVDFDMDLKAAEFAALADGSPYALIPTKTLMDLGASGKYLAKSSTLALLDGENWYLVRVEDPDQVALLKQVYPGFAEMVFPPGSMEPFKE